MTNSSKKKKERKQDFQKQKLKVGKARPKNTNATDTSFAAKSIVLKQQSLSETSREASAIFNHNLSLIGSKKKGTRNADAVARLVWNFVKSAGEMTEELNGESDEVKLLRLRTRKNELVVVPDAKFLLVVVHDTPPA